MSVGRVKNDPLDHYRTPEEETDKLLLAWRPRIQIRKILEPAAGDGAMLRPLHDRFPTAAIFARDIDPSPLTNGYAVRERDFLDREQWKASGDPAKFDLIFTNPPYKRALDFAARSFELLRPGGYLVLLLRMNFIESARRKAWWKKHMPEEVVFLSSRPSFYKSEKGASSDASGYAWFIWRNDFSTLMASRSKWRLL